MQSLGTEKFSSHCPVYLLPIQWQMREPKQGAFAIDSAHIRHARANRIGGASQYVQKVAIEREPNEGVFMPLALPQTATGAHRLHPGL